MSAITRARFLRGDWGARPVSPSPDALARISGLCLAFRAVHCRSCLEACEPEAIRFVPRLGGVSTPSIFDQDCTGCGECRDVCPARAIALVSRNGET
jgi:ferredoxin-type protein NapF